MKEKERYQEARKITFLGGIMNLCLGVLKLAGGILYQSHALIADGLHSFADVFTDLMVIFASKYGSQDADAQHPYGHQRIETAATLLLSLLLIFTGTGIAWEACVSLMHDTHDLPDLMSLPIAFISILANEIFYHVTQRVGRRIRSDLIIANAWHHRSDAAASSLVLLGLLGSRAGYPFFDLIAAIILGVLIIKMGINYAWSSVKELIDTSVNAEILANIVTVIGQIDGVQKIHQLRTRQMGPDVFIDLHIQVRPWLSVSEGHFIAQSVHYKLMKHNDAIKDVTVHVDPEDDETSQPSFQLPKRQELEKRLLMVWQQEFPDIENWYIHYLSGSVHIELVLNDSFAQWPALEERITKSLMQEQEISTIDLLQHKKTLAKKGMRKYHTRSIIKDG